MAAAALWAPPRQPGVSSAAFWNALVSHLGQPLPLFGQAVAVVVLGEPPPPYAHCLDPRGSAGPRFLLRPAFFPFAATFDADLSVEDLPLLPAALREALHEGLVATFSAVLPAPGIGAVTILGAGPLREVLPARDVSDLRWFRIRLEGAAAEPALLDVGIGPAMLAEIFGNMPTPRTVWPALRTRLTRDVAVTLGRLWFDRHRLRALRPGSVIVLDAQAGTGLVLRSGDDLYHFQPQEPGWLCAAIKAASARTGPTMDITPGDAQTAEHTPDGGAARLDVAVDLDLGRITVPLAEMEAWQVGSLVALQAPTSGEGVEIALRVNGQMIGAGELVRIDDRLAVRLVRLSFA